MTEKIFHLNEWTPQVPVAAQEIIDGIHTKTPELEVLFMGAAALKLPGKNDIDLDILCPRSDIPQAVERLQSVLGAPQSVTDSVVAWEFEKDGFEVDCMLSDPTVSHVPRQRSVFERLVTDSHLCDQYERLKRESDGLPYAEYEQRKKAFFASILGE